MSIDNTKMGTLHWPNTAGDMFNNRYRLGEETFRQIPPDAPFPPQTLEVMIYSRFRLQPGEKLKFDKLTCHQLSDGRVATFDCNDDQAAILFDNSDLFPSDQLITQLRLLQKA